MLPSTAAMLESKAISFASQVANADSKTELQVGPGVLHRPGVVGADPHPDLSQLTPISTPPPTA